MRNEINKIETSLMVLEKENILTRFRKWISKLFGKKQEITYVEVKQEITIPKAVKLPVRDVIEEIDENSVEYLYRLTDDQLDDLEEEYNNQIKEAGIEISRLENMLQTCKNSIKKLQEKLSEENI